MTVHGIQAQVDTVSFPNGTAVLHLIGGDLPPANIEIPESLTRGRAAPTTVAQIGAFFGAVNSNPFSSIPIPQDRPQTAEELRRNEERINASFDAMESRMRGLRQQALRELPNLSSEKAEEVVTFWGQISAWFSSVIDWLKRAWEKLVQMVKEATDKFKDAAKAVIDTLNEWWKSLKK
ncbi:hypothetical protein HDU93_009581, partial [Gonapodya sp. JEL0774]